MPSLQHNLRKISRALHWSALAVLASSSAMVAAGEPARSADNPVAGRRLILVYGAKQVDLRSPPSTKTAVEPTAASELPWGIPFREVNSPLPADAGGNSPEANQSERTSSAARRQLDFLDPAQKSERRLLNVLRPADSPLTRLPGVDEETLPNVPVAAQTEPPSVPATADLGSKSTAGTSQPTEDKSPLSGRQYQPITKPANSASSMTLSLPWLEHRLTWLVIALLVTVICLIVMVVQLLATMGRLTGKLIPTIRLEMSNPAAASDSASHAVSLASSNVAAECDIPPEYQKRAGAVVDFANQSVPAELFRGEFEKQRQAELEQRKRLEQAILQDIFQNNLALRQQLQTQAVSALADASQQAPNTCIANDVATRR